MATRSIEEFIASLAKPRKMMIMVKAGGSCRRSIDQLLPHLDKGDVVIDGGNSLYSDTERREAALSAKGFNYLGIGVSGGEEGALKGPSLMPGGTKQALGVLFLRSTEKSRPRWMENRVAGIWAPEAQDTTLKWCTTASSTAICS